MAKAKATTTLQDGRKRVIIEGVSPEIDGGRFPIKRTLEESIQVEADIFADGHDVLAALLKHRHEGESPWTETPMAPLVNDRWRGAFSVHQLGQYFYTVEAWVDRFKTWRYELEKKVKAGLDVSIELLVGAELVEGAAGRAQGADASELKSIAQSLGDADGRTQSQRIVDGLSPRLAELANRYPDRSLATAFSKELRVVVEPDLARCGAWYEMFPRSCSPDPARHGTLQDCEAFLPRIAEMGFDILYFPPIHPIGRSYRKGKNNNPKAAPDDIGSPWAIGAKEGGHKSVLPELGTLEDFQRLVKKAREHRLEIALDIAFQCAPDHPYVAEHPEWFRRRPDGSIQYAENPPKKYQDIYPFDFETPDWRGLWNELKSIFEFWMEQGVKVYRVDNPHTKAFPFWEWCIGELKKKDPSLIFLSEAFTRPKVLKYLAKLGFTQSYNYFPWRNTKYELTEYLTELTQTQAREYLRPNLWPNTPDILTQYLQYGGRPAFMTRFILAATLGASYGIYGPAFELCDNRPREIGTEEYLDSEKYQIRQWDRSAPGNLTGLITAVNRARRENPALRSNDRLVFHPVDNEHIIAYSKHTESLDNIILTVVNLDPHHTQMGWVDVDLAKLGIESDANYQVHDLLTHARYLWHGSRNYVELNPHFAAAHIFRVRRRIRSEQDFDYYM